MVSYLVTGGEGFIGSNIMRESGGTSYDLKSGLDILDTGALEKASQGMNGIFHCAAKISVPESMSKPDEYYRTNVEGTRSVVRAAESANVKIVFSSSAAVYGDADTPVGEEASLNPKSPYAQNKLDGEDALRQSSMPHIALRYFNAYGPGQSPQYAGVITAFIVNALKGEDLIIHGDGSQVRDFVFIDDIVLANMTAMRHENASFELFNIGSGTETSIKVLAEMIIRLTSSTSKIVYREARPGDIVYSRADISRAETVLKWKPTVSLEDGLRKTISHFS